VDSRFSAENRRKPPFSQAIHSTLAGFISSFVSSQGGAALHGGEGTLYKSIVGVFIMIVLGNNLNATRLAFNGRFPAAPVCTPTYLSETAGAPVGAGLMRANASAGTP
jgi:hypothetical protein